MIDAKLVQIVRPGPHDLDSLIATCGAVACLPYVTTFRMGELRLQDVDVHTKTLASHRAERAAKSMCRVLALEAHVLPGLAQSVAMHMMSFLAFARWEEEFPFAVCL